MPCWWWGAIRPPQTSGQRTLARVQQGATILGFEEAVLANLFALPTYRSGGIADLGRTPGGWLDARTALVSGLDDCDGVLLAYGTQEPNGEARASPGSGSLAGRTDRGARPAVLVVGGSARHPSRWQRYTWRELPGIEFREALERSLCHVPRA